MGEFPLDDQAIMLFKRTPRPVPWSIRFFLMGGGKGMPGLFIIGLGVILAWYIGINSDIAAIWQFIGPKQQAIGTVTSVEKTSFSEGEFLDSTPIYKVTYRFEDESGTTHKRTGYDLDWRPTPGDSVTVRYPVGRPDQARVRYRRNKPFDWYVFPITLFLPTIGLYLAGSRIIEGKWMYILLRHGRATIGRVIDKKKIDADNTLYELRVEYTDADGQTRHATVEINKIEDITGADGFRILHHPAKPSRILILKAVLGDDPYDNTGRIRPRLMEGAKAISIPVIYLACLAVYAVIRFT